MADITDKVIIIGGGPAGLTAAIYAAREGLDTFLLEKNVCGGLPVTADLIENYPGFPKGINGMELMDKFKDQAQGCGVRINESEEAKDIQPQGKEIRVRSEKVVVLKDEGI